MGIRHLARELGLSIGTVSRALNDRPDVHPYTRARVKAAAARVGYVPNQSGRSLRSGRTGIVAAVIPTGADRHRVDSGLFAVLEGTRRTLVRASLDLIVLFRGPEEDPLENLQRIAQRRIVDAVIISQTTARDPRLEFLKAAGIDYVAFGRSSGLDGYPFVDFAFETVGVEAARVLLEDGHRRLAVAVSERMANYEEIIVGAFRAAVAVEPAATVMLLPWRGGRATPLARAALASRDGPTAVLAAHESIAAGIYAELAAAGRAVPRDVSVISVFPSLDTADLVPALSHFDADLDAVGVALAERLIALLPENAGRPRLAPVLVPLSFAPRASHGRAADPVTA